jgi:hypothetical protein
MTESEKDDRKRRDLPASYPKRLKKTEFIFV